MFWIENTDVSGPQAIWSPNSATVGVNASATVAPLGTGAFRTSTAGNPRGNNAVDLQMVRNMAGQVAAGNNSVIGGGNNNAALSTASVVSGGSNNSILSGNTSTIGGGTSNIINAGTSTIGGGNTNNIQSVSGTIGGGVDNIISAASSNATIVGGQGNSLTSAASSVAGGMGISLTQPFSTGFGRFNVPGPLSGQTRLFMIGNGTSDVARVNAMSLTAAGGGSIFVPGTVNPMMSADYAEYFESGDNEKYPVGTPVAFTGKDRKIRKAAKGEIPFGVVSDMACVVANGADEFWHHRFIRKRRAVDVYETEMVEKTRTVIERNFRDGKIYLEEKEEIYREPVMDEVEVIGPNGEVVGKELVPRKVKVGLALEEYLEENPEYDPTKKYIPRSQRPEWNIIGLVGVVKILKKGPKAAQWTKISTEEDKDYDYWFIH
jgi:hypothetical protein